MTQPHPDKHHNTVTLHSTVTMAYSAGSVDSLRHLATRGVTRSCADPLAFQASALDQRIDPSQTRDRIEGCEQVLLLRDRKLDVGADDVGDPDLALAAVCNRPTTSVQNDPSGPVAITRRRLRW